MKYELTQSHQDGLTVYGVRICEPGGKFRDYPEISENKNEAVRLLRRMEQGDLSPLHYDDVVRDYLLELAFTRMERNGIR